MWRIVKTHGCGILEDEFAKSRHCEKCYCNMKYVAGSYFGILEACFTLCERYTVYLSTEDFEKRLLTESKSKCYT